MEGRIEIFSQKQVTEIQQGFLKELKEIHTLIYNAMLKSNNFNNLETRLDLIKILEVSFDKMAILQKDINIETTPGK